MPAILLSFFMYVFGLISGIFLLAEYQRRSKKKKGSKKTLLKG
jgi:hypothetical protein